MDGSMYGNGISTLLQMVTGNHRAGTIGPLLWVASGDPHQGEGMGMLWRCRQRENIRKPKHSSTAGAHQLPQSNEADRICMIYARATHHKTEHQHTLNKEYGAWQGPFFFALCSKGSKTIHH